MKSFIVIPLLACVQLCAAQRITLYVADTKAGCYGMAVSNCLQVKEKPGEPYSVFYSGIEGFKYEEGYTYQLEVMRIKRNNPPADVSAYQYYLIQVVKKERTKDFITKTQMIPNQVIMLLNRINRNGRLEHLGNDGGPDIYFDKKNGKVSGNTSCNRYFGKVVFGNSRIAISSLGATRIACFNNDTEMLFMQHLTAVNRYEVKGNALQLLKDNVVLLQFTMPEN